MKWTYPGPPNRVDLQAKHRLDLLWLRFAASGLEPSASIGLFVVPGVAGTFAAVNPRSWGISSRYCLLEGAIAVSGVDRSRLYQLFDETREIKSLSLKRSGRTKKRHLIYMLSLLDFLNNLPGEQALGQSYNVKGERQRCQLGNTHVGIERRCGRQQPRCPRSKVCSGKGAGRTPGDVFPLRPLSLPSPVLKDARKPQPCLSAGQPRQQAGGPRHCPRRRVGNY